MVLMHMMREGEVALIPETVAALRRGDKRLIKQFAEDLENDDGGLLEQNAQQVGGLYNTIECRESWSARKAGSPSSATRARRSAMVRSDRCTGGLRRRGATICSSPGTGGVLMVRPPGRSSAAATP